MEWDCLGNCVCWEKFRFCVYSVSNYVWVMVCSGGWDSGDYER